MFLFNPLDTFSQSIRGNGHSGLLRGSRASELFTSGQILRFPWQDSTYKSYTPFDKLPIQSTNESIDQTDSWGYSIEPVSVRSFLSSFSSLVYPATCIQPYNALTRVNFVRLLLHVIFESNYRFAFLLSWRWISIQDNECVLRRRLPNLIFRLRWVMFNAINVLSIRRLVISI